MQAGTTFPTRNNLAYIALGVIALALLGVAAFAAAGAWTPSTSSVATAEEHGIAYFEFGREADTLWLADASRPSKRERLMTAPHATDFGVIASLSPQGQAFVYNALPPETKAPSADTPADLWLATLSGGQPTRIAQGIDLLVPAVWSADGSSVVVRRSASTLVTIDVDSRTQEKTIATSNGGALFPVAFTPDGRSLLYVTLADDGSQLYAADVATGQSRAIARLGDGLTRDWALSPAGDKLAFLQVTFATDKMASRVYVLDIASGRVDAVGDANADAFEPTWTRDGGLIVGQLAAGAVSAGVVRIGGAALPGPARGFDVPLAAGKNGYVVESFGGSSLRDPGASVLTLVSADGAHRAIATGEVTFLGWIE